MRIAVHAPDHNDVLGWVDTSKVDIDKIDRITHRVGLEAEGAMKSIVHTDTKDATGLTAASIETWLLSRTDNEVSYMVGSQVRGHILRWLDVGRGWVRPVRARALRFWIRGQKVFAQYARPSPALNILFRSASWVWSNLDQIVKEEIEK